MPTKISVKIQEVREIIKAQGDGGPTTIRIGEEGISALLKGIDSAEWAVYMNNFASDHDQLKRLLGKDPKFMNTYGPKLLAYIVAAAPCMSGTSLRLVTEDLPQVEKDKLDEVFA